MKKQLLAAATLSVLMASGMANAAFTDADASGNWTGNLEFNGTITNTNPIWTYQIPDATVAAAKNWDVERVSGVVDGSNTNFSFAKTLTLLEGVVKVPAAHGGSGLTPVVTFGDATNGYTWDTAESGVQSAALDVEVKHGADVVGKMGMSLVSQAASQLVTFEGYINELDRYTNVKDAYDILTAQPWYTPTYGPFQAKARVNVESAGWMGRTDVNKPSAAIVTKAHEFIVTFPTASIPDTWTATLPISITVK